LKPEKSEELLGGGVAQCRNDSGQDESTALPIAERPKESSPEEIARKCVTEFVDQFQITVQLAYYPPYHSKYNPIERVWGVLEKHWNGSLLDTVDTALKFAQTMTWKGKHPVVELVNKTYQKGVKLTRKAMETLEKRFERLPDLGKWFVRIVPVPLALSG
jgi:hypothetical protein